jgi:hypothetical protein
MSKDWTPQMSFMFDRLKRAGLVPALAPGATMTAGVATQAAA